MKCANCDSAALYVYKIIEGAEILYCQKHLPKFLEARKNAGLLPLTPEWEEERAEILEKMDDTVQESPKPAPVKKTVKKSVK